MPIYITVSRDDENGKVKDTSTLLESIKESVEDISNIEGIDKDTWYLKDGKFYLGLEDTYYFEPNIESVKPNSIRLELDFPNFTAETSDYARYYSQMVAYLINHHRNEFKQISFYFQGDAIKDE
jgi:hypothetical protein